MPTINYRDAAATMRAALERQERIAANVPPFTYSAEQRAQARRRADALKRALGGAK